MPKRTTVAEAPPVRLVVVTLDAHLLAAAHRAGARLRQLPALDLQVFAAAEWDADPAAAERCRAAIADADLVVVTHIFLESQVQVLLPALRARRDTCDAMVCVMSAPEIVRQTRLGRFSMSAEGDGGASPWSASAILRRLQGGRRSGEASPEGQMRQLRRIPQLLRFIPGTAQDVRAYYLVLQYWLAGSEENLAGLAAYLVDRYADGPRRVYRGTLKVEPPKAYPEVGLYHPDLPGEHFAEDVAALPARGTEGRVGILLMRSYLLAGNTAHYDAVIRAVESRGLRAVPAFAYGLDNRPAIERFYRDATGASTVDAVVSLTGFSLVGGPAYHDTEAAQGLLTSLDVPYLSAQSLEFQTVEDWRADARGLNPLQATLQVAIPELDGATGPIVFGGKASGSQDAQPIPERIERLAERVARLVALRRAAAAERKVAVVLFNFPPNAGNTGTAAYLSVFESLHRLLQAMQVAGYTVEVPGSADELRTRIVGGNAERFGAAANVHARVSLERHVRGERWLGDIEAVWGPAPGRHQADGTGIQVLGERFGNVFVGVQPGFGYEGDPMRLLFERAFAPTHAFAAFYRWIREDFGAHALLHFGTHGALEFMPGKQVGLDANCWPDRLLGDVPNVYLYASNNPSEGTLAKRRAAATLVSYLTPPIAQAGLYRGLLELKGSLDRYRAGAPDMTDDECHALADLIQTQAAALDLVPAQPTWNGDGPDQVGRLHGRVLELEYSLIPHGMHVLGVAPSAEERVDLLTAMLEAERAEDEPSGGAGLRDDVARLVRDGVAAGPWQAQLERLAEVDRLLRDDHEMTGVLRALDGRFVPPAPGGDLLRTPKVLPTGRNLYGFDPYRVPSAHAMLEGRRQAERLLERHRAEGSGMPETIAMVLWGTDNMKTEGGPLAQALALLGAVPRFDGLGRLIGAELVPLATLGRPRIDVVVTISGIFRDLLPLQVRLLADAAALAAAADEPLELNLVRKHTLAHQQALGGDFDSASRRVFSNAEGAYGSNVNHLVESGRWADESELAETFLRRKGFAYGRGGRAESAPALFRRALAGAELAFQNLESVELGVTDVDQYYESLGGMARLIQRERGGEVPVYIGDQTRSAGKVRTLHEQVALESRTRMLNPKWYEAMLRHGYEGVRQIESHVTTTLGWSATTAAVPEWVYTQVSSTFVLDEGMRERLAGLNPHASARLASRLLEANSRGYWSPDAATLDALRQASDELEDRLEGITP